MSYQRVKNNCNECDENNMEKIKKGSTLLKTENEKEGFPTSLGTKKEKISMECETYVCNDCSNEQTLIKCPNCKSISFMRYEEKELYGECLRCMYSIL